MTAQQRSLVVALVVGVGTTAFATLPSDVLAEAPKTRSTSDSPEKPPGEIPTKVKGDAMVAYCRGPFAVAVGRSSGILVQAKGRLAKKGAGPKGRDLEPGECGWSDQAWSSDWAILEFPAWTYGPDGHIITTCSQNSEYILRSEQTYQEVKPGRAYVEGRRIVSSPRPFHFKG